MDYFFNCECQDEYGENCGRTVTLLMVEKKVKLVDIELGFCAYFNPEQVEVNPNGIVSFNNGEYSMFITSPCFIQNLKVIGGRIMDPEWIELIPSPVARDSFRILDWASGTGERD
jgi:hypothetical protein